MKTSDKFWNFVMGIKTKHIVWTCVAVFLFLFSAELPIPVGVFVNWRHFTYLVNYKGVFYTNSPFAMLAFPFTGNADAGYLKGADFWSFHVLDDNWAKDKSHVWYQHYPVKGVDAATFQLGKNGIPKDKYHVFVNDLWYYSPSQCDIDPATAEYFVQQPTTFDYFTRKPKLEWVKEWMRDSKQVYFYEQRVDVDRATFRWLAGSRYDGQGKWYVDRNYVYTPRGSRPPYELVRLDSLREPLEVIPIFYDEKEKPDTLYHASYYLRNGNHILYSNGYVCRVACEVEVKSIRLDRNRELGDTYICVINDTLRLQRGERMIGERDIVK